MLSKSLYMCIRLMDRHYVTDYYILTILPSCMDKGEVGFRSHYVVIVLLEHLTIVIQYITSLMTQYTEVFCHDNVTIMNFKQLNLRDKIDLLFYTVLTIFVPLDD
jgi:hypothetical protein